MRWPVALGLGRSSKFQCVLLGLLVATRHMRRDRQRHSEGPVWPIATRSTAVPQINTIKLSNGTCRLGRRETPYRAIDGTLRGQFVLLFKIQRMVPRYDIRIGARTTVCLSDARTRGWRGCLSYCRKSPDGRRASSRRTARLLGVAWSSLEYCSEVQLGYITAAIS